MNAEFMQFIVVGSVAFVASTLTFFAGFGLGTMLTPAFALFFPAELAVGLTAIVHFANNLFKVALLGRSADRATVLRFGLPAMAAAFIGAKVLVWLSDLAPLFHYQLAGRVFRVLPVNAAIALLLLVFVLLELSPRFSRIVVPARYLPLGGLLSGFFGGLSGNQGALRSAFLIRAGLSKEQFVASGVVIACVVDITRLSVYAGHFSRADAVENAALLLLACLSAFIGAVLGSRMLKKITMITVQRIVAGALFLIALALGAGIL